MHRLGVQGYRALALENLQQKYLHKLGENILTKKSRNNNKRYNNPLLNSLEALCYA